MQTFGVVKHMVDIGKNMNLPFEETQVSTNTFVRTFFQNTDSGDFTWHRDRETRIIQSVGFTDWKIQIDNELPKDFSHDIRIPMGVWHRIIKGSGDLTLKVIKLVD